VFLGTDELTFSGVEDPERIIVEFVSTPYFSLLGVSAVRGRTFSAEEDLVGTALSCPSSASTA